MHYNFADFSHITIILSTEIIFDFHKTEIISLSKKLKQLTCCYLYNEEFEDIKLVIIIRISKKNRQHMYNGPRKTYTRTSNDLQNIHIKLKIE